MIDALTVGSHNAVALLPVLLFLGGLLLLDSYKLLRPQAVLVVVATGVGAACASFLFSLLALGPWGLSVPAYSQHLAPVAEELLKGAVIVWLARSHRIGFLGDAAIYGFAVGSGFAVVENLAYLRMAHEAGLSTWIVRGFGTAVMHGGATAILAVMGMSVLERSPQAGATAFLPGLAAAAALHWAFNQLIAWPQWATVAVLLVVPAILLTAFHHGERRLAQWLGQGFDADAQLLDTIHSASFAGSPAGQYLSSLRHTFSGPMMADALCYLRLYTELSLRAKGLLMMREHGLPTPAIDQQTLSSLDELEYLERSLGATGLRALQPLLRMRRKELWQLNLLKSA